MIPSRLLRSLFTLLAAWCILPPAAFAKVESRLSTRFLARGEIATLEIVFLGDPPTGIPEIPAIDNVTVQSAGRGVQTRLVPGLLREYVFEYQVSSYTIGNHVIPSVEIQSNGDKFRTRPLEFSVFNPDDLQWSEGVAGNARFRYASAFRVLNTTPFEGEATPVEIKVFLPADLVIAQEGYGIPDFERDGVTAWRFQPSPLLNRINLLGLPHVSVAYPSTLTPTRSGPVSIGPAKLRIITVQQMMDGFLRPVAVEAYLEIPKLEINALPLPPGAPDGFENAVGDFGISVTTTETRVLEGDPIPLDIFVSGSGNLDTLRPPKPVNTDGWKLYDPSPAPRGDERREHTGTIEFRQFMRPLEFKPEIPSFRLVYFDPREKAYKTILSEPITLNMSPAAARPLDSIAPPQALPIPVERMTDILGLLQPASLTLPATTAIPSWTGHAIAGLVALALILKALWMRIRPRLRRDPAREARLAALREIEKLKNTDDTGFLMAAGRFIERFLGSNPSPDLSAVLAERDALCFRGEKPSGTILDPKRRNAIVKTLRNAITGCIAMVFLGNPIPAANAADLPEDNPPAAAANPADLATQARDAYDAARFTDAIALWLQAGPYENLAADTLYNIGNACYRAGSAGHAALYFRRALSRDPGLQEARQNLRFIERKHGAITIHRPEYQYALARFPLAAWKGTLWTGAWLCAIAILVFPATRHGSRLRIAAIVALVVGPLLAAGGALGWRYFPDDAEFAPLAKQAVIVAEDAVLHADASRTSPEVIDAPPGSLCEVIRQSGRWAYVSFATKTRGWIPVEAIESVIPTTQPVPPTIPKPKVDEKSA